MEQKIIQILAEIKEKPELVNQITKETRIIDEIGLDSLEMINFILRIEEDFEVEIEFEEFDLSYLDTVGSFSDYLLNLQAVH